MGDTAVLPGGFKSVKNRWLKEFEREQREQWERQEAEREAAQQQVKAELPAKAPPKREAQEAAARDTAAAARDVTPAADCPAPAAKAEPRVQQPVAPHAAVKAEPKTAGPRPSHMVTVQAGAAADAAALGLIDLGRMSGYQELVAAMRALAAPAAAGGKDGGPRLEHKAEVKLVYRDRAGDWLLLQPDDPFDAFRAVAERLMLV